MRRIWCILTVFLFLLNASWSLAAQETLFESVQEMDGQVGTSKGADDRLTTYTNFVRQNNNNDELYLAKSKTVESWFDATSYILGKQVFVGLDVYTCTAPHLSSSTTQPGVGVSWATAWSFTGKLLTQTQADAIAANTLKVGITAQQASDITANNAKISFDATSSTRLANTSGTNTGDQDLSGKQDALVSGTNIKTINSTSILGAGDIVVEGTGDMVLATPQVVTGAKTFNPSTLAVNGSSTGKTTFITANNSGVDNELVFPGESGNIARVSDIPSTAAALPFVPDGSIAATNVQAAIQEVRDEAGTGGLPALTEGQMIKGGVGGTPEAFTPDPLVVTEPEYSDTDCTPGSFYYPNPQTVPPREIVCIDPSGVWYPRIFGADPWSDPAPTTYSLTLDLIDALGADKLTVNAVDYTVDSVIPGLTGNVTITATPDTGREVACSGAGITGTGPYVADMSADRTAACTFSDTAVTYLLNETFGTGTIPTGWSVVSGDATVTWIDKMAYTYGTTVTTVYTDALSAPSNHPYFQFKLKAPSLPAANIGIFTPRSSSSNRGTVVLYADGSLAAWPSSGTLVQSAAGVVTAGVDIFIRVELIKATVAGNDSVMTVSTSPDGTTWTQRATSTDGTNTSDWARGSFVLTEELYEISNFKVANVPFNM